MFAQRRATSPIVLLGPMVSASPMVTVPQEVFAAVLQKLILVDKEGYFQMPVDEQLHHAPNYYIIIKHPMCFHEMKNRLASGAYTSLRQMREDFELICSNARTFNKNTTKVYKAALNLHQKGSKILKQHELEARKAFTTQAAPASTGGDAAAFGRGGQDFPSNGAFFPAAENGAAMVGSTPGSVAGAGDGPFGSNSWFPEDYQQQSLLAPPFFPQQQLPPPQQQQQLASWPSWPLPAMQLQSLQPLCTYVSSDEEEGAGDGEAGREGALPAAGGGRRRGGGDEPLDRVLQRMRTAVEFKPWPAAATHGTAEVAGPSGGAALLPPLTSADAVMTDVSAAAAALPATAGVLPGRGASSGGGSGEASGRTAEWRAERAPVEWQCRCVCWREGTDRHGNTGPWLPCMVTRLPTCLPTCAVHASRLSSPVCCASPLSPHPCVCLTPHPCVTHPMCCASPLTPHVPVPQMA